MLEGDEPRMEWSADESFEDEVEVVVEGIERETAVCVVVY